MQINAQSPQTEVRKDKEGHIQKLNHRISPVRPDDKKVQNTTDLAALYVQEVASLYEIEQQISNLREQPSFDPENNNLELRLLEEKEKQSLSILTFSQTYFGLPIWKAALALRIDQKDMSVISSVSSLTYDDLQVKRPDQSEISNYEKIRPNELAELLGFGSANDLKINESGNLHIYKYLEETRLGEPLKEADLKPLKEIPSKLKPVNLAENKYYIVKEVLFSYTLEGIGLLNWRCFIELETGNILYLTPFTSSVTGLVFEYDPITQGANVDVNDSDSTLNQHRTAVTLQRLENPGSGNQELRGDSNNGYAFIIDPTDHPNDPLHSSPAENPPNEPSSNNFNYNAPTADFAAVNAYFYVDRFIALIVDLGIQISDQFPNTSIPLHIDHRGWNDQFQASAPGNLNGTASIGIRLGAASTQSPYLGMGTAYRVILHEFGHVLLYDHANSPNFGFAHSYGDSLAAILNDPVSQAPDRFYTFPWADSAGSAVGRRHDRSVSAGWAWDGSNDGGGYSSEQILSTTLFRIYRSLGGDSTATHRKEYAARITVLLMLKAVQEITSSTNPSHAEDFADLMMEVDTLSNPPITLDNIDLGASHKVIRWGFEKQGAYQSTPFGNKEGQPPAVDVYIDDGRNGEYPYLDNFWVTTDIINRTQPGSTFVHQVPILNTTNYIYVKIKNRGTSSANNIVVKGYHCKPGGGLVWPQDWQPMQTAQINVQGSLGSGQSTIVGPFQWVPTQQGHECILMTVSATGDEANTETVDPVPHWFLVPNDNNVAQRNVAPAPGFHGGGNLVDAFEKYQFHVLNPYHHPIHVNLQVKLPALLADRNWNLIFTDPGEEFELEEFDREGILVRMQMEEGEPFTKEDVLNAEDRDITITMMTEEGVIGGMTYRLDPDLETYDEGGEG